LRELAASLHFFSLVSDQPVCTVKALGSVTPEILTRPRAGALSGSRRSSRKTFQGKSMIPLPYTPDFFMQNKVPWGPFPPPLEICPLKIPRVSFSFQIVGGGDRTLPEMKKRSVVKYPPVLITWFDICFYEPGPLCL